MRMATRGGSLSIACPRTPRPGAARSRRTAGRFGSRLRSGISPGRSRGAPRIRTTTFCAHSTCWITSPATRSDRTIRVWRGTSRSASSRSTSREASPRSRTRFGVVQRRRGPCVFQRFPASGRAWCGRPAPALELRAKKPERTRQGSEPPSPKYPVTLVGGGVCSLSSGVCEIGGICPGRP